MTGDVQVIYQTAKHIFVRRGNVVIQLRGEEHSIEALEAQETGILLARAQLRGPLGALLVIEESAPAPRGEVAKRQRSLVGSFASDERVFICLVLEGSGVGVALKRTLARGVFRGPRRHISATVREGARWLATELGDAAGADALVDFVDKLRAR